MTAITFVAAGTASATDAATPAPALPAGIAEGDLLIAAFYSREVTDGVVQGVSGWNQVFQHRDAGGILGVWSKIYKTGDLAITWLLSGFAAGDDCIAQIAAYRNAGNVQLATPIVLNGALEDIGPIPGCTLPPREVVIVLGGKLDDWTSVAALSGDNLTWAEIGEPDTTTGTDAGMVWDYAINGNITTVVTVKTFDVTGGTSVAGKGCMLRVQSLDDQTVYARKRTVARAMHGRLVGV